MSKHVKMKMTQWIRNSMHFSTNSQIQNVTTAEEYVDFNVETYSSFPAINSIVVNWRVSSVKACVNEYLRK